MNDVSLPVLLQRCSSYDRPAIKDLIDRMADSLSLPASLHGRTVLLKPNLISGRGPSFACTHGEFIAAVAGWFLDRGAKVVVGDSPAFGTATRVCQSMGISRALRTMDVRVVDFVSPVKKRLAGGVTVSVAKEALDCDLFVGLPKIKAHNQMFMTMAVKNVFGVVKGVNKAMLHMVHGDSHEQFAAIILDLLALLPEQIHLADGIEVMHGSGPLDGRPLALNCVAGSVSPVALDTALLHMLELDCRKSPLWRLAAKRKLRGSDKDGIDYPLLLPQDFHRSGFLAPDELNGIRFNPFRFLRGLAHRVYLRVCCKAG